MFLYGKNRSNINNLFRKWWDISNLSKYLKLRISLPWTQLRLKGNANGDAHFDVKVLKEHVNGTSPCVFEGMITNCRSDYDWYLTNKYGKDWRVPRRWCSWEKKQLCPELDNEEIKRCKVKTDELRSRYGPKITLAPSAIRQKEFGWRDCKIFTNIGVNRTEALYNQLKKVIRVLNNTNYIVGYGTLLGIIRDNKMNENEVDNDIIVDKTFNPESLKEELFKEGLIVFKHGIYRICTYNPTPTSNTAPWTSKSEYSIYTDIYNQLPHVLVDPEKTSTVVTTKFAILQRKFRDIYVNVPDDELISEWFGKRYGNWKVPSISGWKLRVKTHFNERPAWCTKFPNRWNGDGIEVSFVDILKYFNTTMLTNGIDYSLVFGSALGYKRHSDFIPWDDDVDLLIKKNDSSTARALVQKPFCTAKFWGGWKIFKCDSPRTSKYEWSYPFVDVFDNGNTDKHKKSAHDDILFPSVGVFMHGMALRGPKRLTKHLALLYGDDYMETCESPYWNHKTETGIANYKRFPCKDVLACFTE
jgi:hypothetical protein